MDFREQFKKETGKKLGKTYTFDCEYCDSELGVDVWNDDYIFWLEKKLTEVNECVIPDVMPRFLIANSTPTVEGKECLTVGKSYEILNEYDGWVCVIDDHNRMEVMVESFFNEA